VLEKLNKMGLVEILQKEIKEGKYRTENQIRIIARYDKINLAENVYFTAEREDILQYLSFHYEDVVVDAEARKLIEKYIAKIMPNVDTPELYVNVIWKFSRLLNLPERDLIANRLLSEKKLDAFIVYEKKGHYFTSLGGQGHDITQFIEEHFHELIGIRDKPNTARYRPYILFAVRTGGKNDK